MIGSVNNLTNNNILFRLIGLKITPRIRILRFFPKFAKLFLSLTNLGNKKNHFLIGLKFKRNKNKRKLKRERRRNKKKKKKRLKVNNNKSNNLRT